ncbi:hypothetical protein HZH66_014863 [Vespula vulgaris]|uniref:Uncharacterized protein n=1 Tax=Vespula vulgaris TaxID=7454 RepID=A0A834J0C6_VESVU|nr:hypothetical protein HZH66_014863 [Vespula vulgaris]
MRAFVGISREKAYPWHSNAAAFHPHSTPAVHPRDIKGGPLSRFTLYKPTKATRLKIEKKSRGLATEKSRVSYLKHPTREIPIASEDLDVGVEEKEAWRAKAKVCLWPLSFNIGAGMQGLGGKEASGDRFDGWAVRSRIYDPRGRERICQSGFLIYFGVTTPEARWRPRQNERSMRRDPPIDQPKSFDLVDLTSSTLLHGLSSCEAFSSLA